MEQYKNKVRLLVWGICIVNSVLQVLGLQFKELIYLDIGVGWTSALNLFVGYFFLIQLTVQNKKNYICKYMVQISLWFCNYYVRNFANEIELVFVCLIVLLNIVMAISLTQNVEWNIDKLEDRECYFCDMNFWERCNEKTSDLEEKRISNVVIMNFFSLLFIILFSGLGSIFAEFWEEIPLLLLGVIIWYVIFVLISVKKYDYYNISKRRFILEMFFVLIGISVGVFGMKSKIDFYMILLQIYCYTPYLISFLKMNEYYHKKLETKE